MKLSNIEITQRIADEVRLNKCVGEEQSPIVMGYPGGIAQILYCAPTLVAIDESEPGSRLYQSVVPGLYELLDQRVDAFDLLQAPKQSGHSRAIACSPRC